MKRLRFILYFKNLRSRANKKLKNIYWNIISKFYINRAEIIADDILSFINDGDLVLDFGCGPMLISKNIASKKDISSIGIDIDKYQINKGNFIMYDGGPLPFQKNKFDVALAIFALHHTEDPEFYLNELARITKGRIIICEDTYTNFIEEIFTKSQCYISNFLSGEMDIRKRNFKSVEEWKKIFQDNNLKLLTFRRFYPLFNFHLPTKNIIMELKKSEF